MASLVVVVALVFVGWSFVYPVVKVMFSHVSKRHIVMHECERKCFSYSATVAELASDGCLPLSATFGI
jgi:hypothetical protein